jgi:hypothetical protein
MHLHYKRQSYYSKHVNTLCGQSAGVCNIKIACSYLALHYWVKSLAVSENSSKLRNDLPAVFGLYVFYMVYLTYYVFIWVYIWFMSVISHTYHISSITFTGIY